MQQQNNTTKYYQYRPTTYLTDKITKFKRRKLLNLVRRQFPYNKSQQDNEKQKNYTSEVIFLERGCSFFCTFFFLFSLIIWSPRALKHGDIILNSMTEVYMSPNKCTYATEKYLLKTLVGRGTDRNIIKISCHSRLFFCAASFS